MKPGQFAKLVSASEIALGVALVLPVVPSALAGLGLTAFSGALLGMYAQTPDLRKPGSVWPSQQGIVIAKDSWMLGIGLGLVVDSLADRRRTTREVIDAVADLAD
jgi:hypothetical protein